MLASVMLLLATPSANAALIFVGQWKVDDGPNWTTNPPVYSGQEAAALLFGGLPSDYSISTLNANPASINNQAWYSIWGVSGGTQGAENLHIDLGAPGYNTPGGTNTAWSAYVDDNAKGSTYTNCAFRNVATPTPEPATLTMFGLGVLGFVGVALRRGKQAA